MSESDDNLIKLKEQNIVNYHERRMHMKSNNVEPHHNFMSEGDNLLLAIAASHLTSPPIHRVVCTTSTIVFTSALIVTLTVST